MYGSGRRKPRIADATMRPWLLSIYIHIPFCTVRCAYCDFNTYAGLEGLMPPYAAAVQRDLSLVAPFFSGEQEGSVSDSAEVHSVFFGGGTPSLLVPDLIEAILRVVGREFRLAHSCEITLEANPGTLGLALPRPRPYLRGRRLRRRTGAPRRIRQHQPRLDLRAPVAGDGILDGYA